MKRAAKLEAVSALGVGLLFGLGLVVSGMSDPHKVLGFLDLFGRWDPSLALVMGGAVAVGMAGFALDAGRTRSMLGMPMRLPTNREVDRRLLVGASTFGIGWGLVGLCPGPALVALAGGSRGAFVFFAGMLAGMALFEITPKRAEPGDAGTARASPDAQ